MTTDKISVVELSCDQCHSCKSTSSNAFEKFITTEHLNNSTTVLALCATSTKENLNNLALHIDYSTTWSVLCDCNEHITLDTVVEIGPRK